jgi:hypothetical protein
MTQSGAAASSLPLDMPQIAARHAHGGGALAHGPEVYRQRTFAVETPQRAHAVARPGGHCAGTRRMMRQYVISAMSSTVPRPCSQAPICPWFKKSAYVNFLEGQDF